MIQNKNILIFDNYNQNNNTWIHELSKNGRFHVTQVSGTTNESEDTYSFTQCSNFKSLPFADLVKQDIILFYCNNIFLFQILKTIESIGAFGKIPLVAFINNDNIETYSPFINKFSVIFAQNKYIYDILSPIINIEQQALVVSWPWVFNPYYQHYTNNKDTHFICEVDNIKTFHKALSQLLILSVNLEERLDITFSLLINSKFENEYLKDLVLPILPPNFTYINTIQERENVNIVKLLYNNNSTPQEIEDSINEYLHLVDENHVLFIPSQEITCNFGNTQSFKEKILYITDSIIGNKKELMNIENQWRLSYESLYGVISYVQETINAQVIKGKE
jgi:hypothetical protein